MHNKIYFLFFFLFLFWTYCLYWPLKRQKKTDTPVEFFLHGRQIPGWIFALVATGTIFSGWVFIAHPALVFSNGLPFSMTSLSAIMIPLFGVFLMKRQWMLSKRFGFITPSEMISVYFKSDLIRILSGLMKRADKLDAIIVETTGLADPAPVAQTFFVDQDVADRTKLDAIVTVADAVHLSSQLTEHHEAEEQIAFADVILLNKVDLVDESGLDRVKDRIKKINPFAKIINTTRCSAPLDEVVGLNAFSLDRILEVEPDFLESDHDHEHDDDVTSLSFVSDTPLAVSYTHLTLPTKA